MDEELRKKYIPLDKSWAIRMGVLDLIHGYKDTFSFLEENNQHLSDDLIALLRISKQWNNQQEIDVGESGTLYRFLQFASWKLKLNKKFIKRGTLEKRNICDNSEIINWPLEKLLTLDNGTSQWASASVLLGNSERIDNSPFKLKVSYEAYESWNNARKNGKELEMRYDETILAQAEAYLGWKNGRKLIFIAEQAEDYCFARAFDLIDAKTGEEKWPSLRGHESDRISEMEIALQEEIVSSKDHRVIQAIAMLRRGDGKFENPDAVKKSWPQFWDFIDYSLNSKS